MLLFGRRREGHAVELVGTVCSMFAAVATIVSRERIVNLHTFFTLQLGVF